MQRLVTLGKRCRQQPDTTLSTQCETILMHLFGTECRDWTLGWLPMCMPRTPHTSARSDLAI